MSLIDNSVVKSYLESSGVTIIDLYSIEIQKYDLEGNPTGPGVTYYFANNPDTIVWNQKTWLPANVSRSDLEAKLDLETFQLTVTIDNIKTDIATHLARLNPASGKLTIYAYLADIELGFKLSEAAIRSYKVIEESIELTLSSGLDVIFQSVPRRKFSPRCPWRFMDSNCGVTTQTVVTGTMTSSDSSSRVYLSDEKKYGENFFTNGTFEITEGNNKGFSGNILRHKLDPDTGLEFIDFIPPLPFDFEGDKYKITNVCGKIWDLCLNRSRFGGFPIIPVKVLTD
ncbi:MAG: baseplate hub domain-containing protein [Promethearchaeota archaeon]